MIARRMNVRAHLSRTTAPISASHTIWPSTFATPYILHIMPRTCSISSSNRSWSPGFTGRRHFTLLSDVKYTTLFSRIGHGAHQQHAAHLRHRLDDQHARHDRMPRESAPGRTAR